MHVMIDLETMSLAPNAALVSIGAVMMTEQGETIDSFYRNVSLVSSVNAGLHVDPATILWWMQQSDQARDALTLQSRPLDEALKAFSEWMVIPNSSERLIGVWGNGAASDNVWLAEAYRAVGWPRPWSHKQDRCYRTFRAMHTDVAPPQENENAHNALADAHWQADFMRNVCKEKGLVLA